MKKLISMMMIAIVAMSATSCDKDDNGGVSYEFGLTGDKYVGTLTTYYNGNPIGVTTDYVIYADADADSESESESVDIMMPTAQFVSAMPAIDMAMLDIELTTSQNPDIYEETTAQMVGIYDHSPLINDVVKSISNVKVIVSYDGSLTVSFDCTVDTEYYESVITTNVIFEGVKSTDLTTGLFVTPPSGTSLIDGATLTYYKGNNALVIDGYTHIPSMVSVSKTVLPIVGVTEYVDEDLTTLSVGSEGLDVNYNFMGSYLTDPVKDLTCSIVDGYAELQFTIYIYYDGGELAVPCTYYGSVTTTEESYEANDPVFTLDFNDGFCVGTQNSGDVEIPDVTVTYFEGDNTLVVYNFKYTDFTMAPTTTLAITDLTKNIVTDGRVSITGDDIEVSYTMNGDDYDGVVSDLLCEVIDKETQIEFSILYSEYDYPCTFAGSITIEEGNYSDERK
ncbi:MAG: hypothetical protein SNG10_05850 [Rikenellaceae bacterium]